MNNFVNLAKTYSKAGYSVIPVGTNKIPTIRKWSEFQNNPMTEEQCEEYFENAFGMALICGGKHSLTTIDIDLKNDLSGDLYERLKDRIPNSILSKMYVQQTQSGGYHFVFSCPEIIEGNQKLASRFTTADERHQVYIENFENPLTKNKALKIANNHIHLCTIETRGEGGYILINPTKGYTKVYGKISVISKEEYYTLLDSIREFNEVARVPVKDSRIKRTDNKWKKTPYEDYNDRADVPFLLESNGWSIVGKPYGKNIRFKRPGHSSTSSALFDTATRIFTCFSTSTSLDANKGYTPSNLFIHYECGDDVGEAYKKLSDLNFGIEK